MFICELMFDVEVNMSTIQMVFITHGRWLCPRGFHGQSTMREELERFVIDSLSLASLSPAIIPAKHQLLLFMELAP